MGSFNEDFEQNRNNRGSNPINNIVNQINQTPQQNTWNTSLTKRGVPSTGNSSGSSSSSKSQSGSSSSQKSQSGSSKSQSGSSSSSKSQSGSSKSQSGNSSSSKSQSSKSSDKLSDTAFGKYIQNTFGSSRFNANNPMVRKSSTSASNKNQTYQYSADWTSNPTTTKRTFGLLKSVDPAEPSTTESIIQNKFYKNGSNGYFQNESSTQQNISSSTRDTSKPVIQNKFRKDGSNGYFTYRTNTSRKLFLPKKSTETSEKITEPINRLKSNIVPTFTKLEPYRKKVEEYTSYVQKNRNNISQKYNLDLNNFTMKDFNKWANSHNLVYDYSYDNVRGNGQGKVTQDNLNDAKQLLTLAKDNENHKGSNVMRTVRDSFLDSATFGFMPWLETVSDKAAYRNKDGSDLLYSAPIAKRDANKINQQLHPIASGIGATAGTLASMAVTGAMAHNAISVIPGLSGTSPWIQKSIESGITFGLNNGFQSIGHGESLSNIVKSASRGAVGGAVGSAVSSAVSNFGKSILFSKELQGKIIPEMARNAMSSIAFAGGDTVSTYMMYSKEERPTTEEIVKNLSVAFAFGTINTATELIRLTDGNKTQLDNINKGMEIDYQELIRKANSDLKKSGNYNKELITLAENIGEYSNAMNEYLNGRGYRGTIAGKVIDLPSGASFIGQRRYVDSMCESLSTISERASEIVKNHTFDGLEKSLSPLTAVNMAADEYIAVKYPALYPRMSNIERLAQSLYTRDITKNEISHLFSNNAGGIGNVKSGSAIGKISSETFSETRIDGTVGNDNLNVRHSVDIDEDQQEYNDNLIRNLSESVDNSGESDIINVGKNAVFNSKSDPMYEVTGAAEISNPKELSMFKNEIISAGASLISADEEKLAYAPGLRKGEPGTVYVSKGASFSAWCHEMQHFRDDRDSGWLGMRILEDTDLRYEREKKAYALEIELAKEKGRYDIVKRLEYNLEMERKRLYERKYE